METAESSRESTKQSSGWLVSDFSFVYFFCGSSVSVGFFPFRFVILLRPAIYYLKQNRKITTQKYWDEDAVNGKEESQEHPQKEMGDKARTNQPTESYNSSTTRGIFIRLST